MAIWLKNGAVLALDGSPLWAECCPCPGATPMPAEIDVDHEWLIEHMDALDGVGNVLCREHKRVTGTLIWSGCRYAGNLDLVQNDLEAPDGAVCSSGGTSAGSQPVVLQRLLVEGVCVWAYLYFQPWLEPTIDTDSPLGTYDNGAPSSSNDDVGDCGTCGPGGATLSLRYSTLSLVISWQSVYIDKKGFPGRSASRQAAQ